MHDHLYVSQGATFGIEFNTHNEIMETTNCASSSSESHGWLMKASCCTLMLASVASKARSHSELTFTHHLRMCR